MAGGLLVILIKRLAPYLLAGAMLLVASCATVETAEPATDPKAGPAAEPAAEPATQPVPEPAAEPVPDLRVLEYGIYSATPEGIIKTPETTMGSTIISRDFKLIEETDRVPIARDTVFGIYMILDDPRYESILVTRRIIHPEMDDPYRKVTTTMSVSERALQNGIAVHYGYRLEEPFEMLPGDWTFEIWYADSLLCSQTFTLY
jgi:uncharacterized protein DUF3859